MFANDPASARELARLSHDAVALPLAMFPTLNPIFLLLIAILLYALWQILNRVISNPVALIPIVFGALLTPKFGFIALIAGVTLSALGLGGNRKLPTNSGKGGDSSEFTIRMPPH